MWLNNWDFKEAFLEYYEKYFEDFPETLSCIKSDLISLTTKATVLKSVKSAAENFIARWAVIFILKEDYYPRTETKTVEVAYGYGEIITFTDLVNLVHDILMEENKKQDVEEIIIHRTNCLLNSMLKKANCETAKKTFSKNTRLLVSYFDKCPLSILERALEARIGYFEGFIIALTATWKHLMEKCFFCLKQASKYNAERDSERTFCLRQELISKWKEIGVDFQKNCEFID
ncbi:MAG: hypothetical protein EXX96DRAFT_537836 [Benjaminiella poitrasii]|nr:MAG: hypothetical protein EXX96DRAFT_537836 [Benjaminiella poitrasii]